MLLTGAQSAVAPTGFCCHTATSSRIKEWQRAGEGVGDVVKLETRTKDSNKQSRTATLVRRYCLALVAAASSQRGYFLLRRIIRSANFHKLNKGNLCGSQRNRVGYRNLDSDELRLETIRFIEANPSMSQRQISDELGISLGESNYCLKALIEIGGVQMENPAKLGQKIRYLYVFTPRGLNFQTGRKARFLAKKRDELDALLQEIGRLEFEMAAARKRSQLCLG
ncbi:MAG: MarR family EPS-associated transcriptional regulator [Proteobacteria bacterium]|mgnify:CR=1 FL=1|nr:MarR family EPS-associated transcriptional regulator [Pseudomonadota bacterium]